MSEITNLLEKKCRVCFQEEHLECITIKYEIECEWLPISQMISSCTGLEVSNFDQLSKMCNDCIGELIRAYKFRRKCLVSYETILELHLKGALNESSVKEELYDEEPQNELLMEKDSQVFKTDPDKMVSSKKNDEDLTFEFCDVDSDSLTVELTIDADPVKVECINDSSNGSDTAAVEKSDEDYIPEKPVKKVKKLKKEKVKKPEKVKTKKIKKLDKKLLFHCPICPENTSSFRSPVLLKAHHIMEHDKTGQCDKCTMTFKTYKALRNHITRHRELKVHTCSICNINFDSRKLILDHMATHTGERPFKCELCDYSGSSQGSFKQHMARHTGLRPFKCRFCDKTYVCHSGRDYHEKTHSDERPYKCSFCDKSFRARNLWHEHFITHQPDLHFVCEYCGKTFGRKKNLVLHSRLHTGKTYCCEICGKSFVQNAFLVTHIKKNHPETQMDKT